MQFHRSLVELSHTLCSRVNSTTCLGHKGTSTGTYDDLELIVIYYYIYSESCMSEKFIILTNIVAVKMQYIKYFLTF
jgi:hypothetical protein